MTARWGEVDAYLTELLAPPDDVLEAVLAGSATAGLPAHEVSAPQGKLLHVLARAIGARSVLEVGTLGGYSTAWLARALTEGGRVVTVEANARHADVARANLERAGVADRVDVLHGRSRDVLPRLAAERRGPFDLVFLDGDKAALAGDFAAALALSRRGTLIVADNVVRGGAIVDATSDDVRVLGARAFLEALAAEPRVAATAVQTVGAKGHDGFVVAVVTG